ncbi:MAG: hypothetical protein HOW73_10265 [Polyangiaceae bacterium]|nr:hypothetical protein [Polyangiaceae bacterium]
MSAQAKASPPTDLELMMYFDGELDEPRCSEVRAHVEGASSGAHVMKLGGLSLLQGVVREHASARSSAQADGLADAIMAKIASEGTAAEGSGAEGSGAEGSGGEGGERSAEVVALKVGLDEAARSDDRARSQRPAAIGSRLKVGDTPAANENGRLILGLAAAAAAAAAALFIWGRSAPDVQPTAMTGAPSAPAEIVAGDPAPTAESDAVASTQAQPQEPLKIASNEEDAPRSVEVAAVDFGSRPGLVYYVSGSDQAMSTTVVWVRDE